MIITWVSERGASLLVCRYRSESTNAAPADQHVPARGFGRTGTSGRRELRSRHSPGQRVDALGYLPLHPCWIATQPSIPCAASTGGIHAKLLGSGLKIGRAMSAHHRLMMDQCCCAPQIFVALPALFRETPKGRRQPQNVGSLFSVKDLTRLDQSATKMDRVNGVIPARVVKSMAPDDREGLQGFLEGPFRSGRRRSGVYFHTRFKPAP